MAASKGDRRMNEELSSAGHQSDAAQGMHPPKLMMVMCPLFFAVHVCVVIVIFRRIARLEKALTEQTSAN
jgi:hypothetical protein